ncbi:unnamed protein product, partial [Mesorhabditis belari]|uniref:Uncharacterized protein n=1 Tax=Mesorhabditis belari TaxID=2138241 RepID=A0AAF3FKD9_9BILA
MRQSVDLKALLNFDDNDFGVFLSYFILTLLCFIYNSIAACVVQEMVKFSTIACRLLTLEQLLRIGMCTISIFHLYWFIESRSNEMIDQKVPWIVEAINLITSTVFVGLYYSIVLVELFLSVQRYRDVIMNEIQEKEKTSSHHFPIWTALFLPTGILLIIQFFKEEKLLYDPISSTVYSHGSFWQSILFSLRIISIALNGICLFYDYKVIKFSKNHLEVSGKDDQSVKTRRRLATLLIVRDIWMGLSFLLSIVLPFVFEAFSLQQSLTLYIAHGAVPVFFRAITGLLTVCFIGKRKRDDPNDQNCHCQCTFIVY